jgi:hypothetical protein
MAQEPIETLVRIFFSSGRVETRPLENVTFCFLDDMKAEDIKVPPKGLFPPRDHLVVLLDKVDAVSVHQGTFARKTEHGQHAGSGH